MTQRILKSKQVFEVVCNGFRSLYAKKNSHGLDRKAADTSKHIVQKRNLLDYSSGAAERSWISSSSLRNYFRISRLSIIYPRSPKKFWKAAVQNAMVLKHGLQIRKAEQFRGKETSKTVDFRIVSRGFALNLFRCQATQIPQNPGRNLLKNTNLIMLRRCYHADRGRRVQQLRMRGPRAWIFGPEGGEGAKRITILVLVAGGAFTIVYVTHLETVPYTNRKHFVLISSETEKLLGETTFQDLKAQFHDKILPPHHPEVIQVRRIVQRIIEAAMAGIDEESWNRLDYGSTKYPLEARFLRPNYEKDAQANIWLESPIKHEDIFDEDAQIDDEWIEKSRKEGLDKGHKGYIEHLKAFDWEIVVVDVTVVNAVCLPGGKIVVFTGILKHFPKDDQIATILGHEVAHAVARHSAETLTRSIFVSFLELLVLIFFNAPALIGTASDLLLRLPFSRRMEMEADNIGMLLMAAAGYDPRVAPSVYEKLGELENLPEYAQYLSTHPSGKRRAELLRKSKTLEKAVRIYESKKYGQHIRGFLFT